jgi:hypothetical protein
MKIFLTIEQIKQIKNRIEIINIEISKLNRDEEDDFGKLLYLDIEHEALKECVDNNFFEIE